MLHKYLLLNKLVQDQVLTQSIMFFFSIDHHVGTEAEQSSLFASTAACNSDQEASEIEALQSWYR